LGNKMTIKNLFQHFRNGTDIFIARKSITKKTK